MMLNWSAVCWFSSVFILTTFSSPSRSLAISSTTGATIRHGPHHGAQKSTRTGTSDSMTSAGKLLWVTSGTVPAISWAPWEGLLQKVERGFLLAYPYRNAGSHEQRDRRSARRAGRPVRD